MVGASPAAAQLRIHNPLAKAGIYAILIFFAIVVLLPLLWLLSSSLKSLEDLSQNVWGLPKKVELKNYVFAWNQSHMGVYLRNSFVATLVAILVSTAAATTMAHALARFRFRINRLIYYLVIAGMMIPIHSAVIPLYLIALKWKMQNNLIALGLIYAAFRIPVSVFILESFMLTIPKELEECAIIDGCGHWKIFWKIVAPLARDGVVTIMVLTAQATWNELLVAMLMLSKPALKTLPIGVMGFLTEYVSSYQLLCAGLILALIPNLIFYALMQEKIERGMTVGAVKG
jgi:raffinose/stachyose/melibiose transport system permease protein